MKFLTNISQQIACFCDHNWWRPRDGRSNWAGPRASDFPLPYGCPADFIWEPHYLTGPARCHAGHGRTKCADLRHALHADLPNPVRLSAELPPSLLALVRLLFHLSFDSWASCTQKHLLE